jgi:predicted XRE-type DNA-binding protein
MPRAEDPVPRLKQELRIAILEAVGRHGQLSAAATLGLDWPRMSDLDSGNLERFGLQKLVRLLARINRRVEVTVIEVGPVPYRLYGPPRSPFPPGWENYEDWYPRDLLPRPPKQRRNAE